MNISETPMNPDYQLLMSYKHNLRQKWRVLFIGASYAPKQRALISTDKRNTIRLDRQNKISLAVPLGNGKA